MPSQSQNVDADTLVVDVDRIVEKLVDDDRFEDLVETLISQKRDYFAEKWVETRKHLDQAEALANMKASFIFYLNTIPNEYAWQTQTRTRVQSNDSWAKRVQGDSQNQKSNKNNVEYRSITLQVKQNGRWTRDFHLWKLRMLDDWIRSFWLTHQRPEKWEDVNKDFIAWIIQNEDEKIKLWSLRIDIDLPKKDPDTESIKTKLETQREKYNKEGEEQVNFEAPETLYRVYKCQKGDCSSWRIQNAWEQAIKNQDVSDTKRYKKVEYTKNKGQENQEDVEKLYILGAKNEYHLTFD